MYKSDDSSTNWFQNSSIPLESILKFLKKSFCVFVVLVLSFICCRMTQANKSCKFIYQSTDFWFSYHLSSRRDVLLNVWYQHCHSRLIILCLCLMNCNIRSQLTSKPHAVIWCTCLFIITFEHTWKASAILGVAIAASGKTHVHPLSHKISLRIVNQAILMNNLPNMSLNLCFWNETIFFFQILNFWYDNSSLYFFTEIPRNYSKIVVVNTSVDSPDISWQCTMNNCKGICTSFSRVLAY